MSIIKTARTFLLFLSATFILSSTATPEITLDGTVGPAGALQGPKYTISADMGKQAGGNLFHSFSSFNLNKYESATFTGPASIANIISRVTGGSPSYLDGLLRTSIAGADLYFINPSGIVFGPNATLDVGGSFHASTASTILLADGSRFDAINPQNPILTTAPPGAFGFLSDSVNGISVLGSFLQVPAGRTLSLIGGGIDMRNATLYAPSGQINAVAVASPGTVTLVAQVPVLDGFTRLGDISIVQTSPTRPTVQHGGITLVLGNMDAGGDRGGGIYIRGQRFVMDNGQVLSNTYGPVDGGIIRVEATGETVLQNHSEISSKTDNIEGLITMGKASDISVKADRLVLTEGSQISERSLSTADGGNVTIEAKDISLSGIYQEGDEVFGSGIFTRTHSFGNAGSLHLKADTLTLSDGAEISGNTFGSGSGGTIDIQVKDLSLSGYALIGDKIKATTISTQSSGSGKAGDIGITSSTTSLANGAQITASSLGKGEGGTIDIQAKAVTLKGHYLYGDKTLVTGIYSQALDEGDAGRITVKANTVDLSGGARITAGSRGKGGAGTVSLETDRLTMSGDLFKVGDTVVGSAILTEALSSGKGGETDIRAKDILLTGGAQISGSTTAEGAGGDIRIVAEKITLAGHSVIDGKAFGTSLSSQTLGAGNAGLVDITADTLSLTDGARINTSSRGAGAGGSVRIHALGLSLAGHYEVAGRTFSSGIFSTANAAGKAGSIDIKTNSASVTEGAAISASSQGAGAGGSVTIDANTITITGNEYTVDGRVYGSGIYSAASDKGKGGSIALNAKVITLNSGALVSALSTGPANAGNITLRASNVLDCSASAIKTSADQAAGGNIDMQGANVWFTHDSSVSAEVRAGEGGGGNVTINAGTFVALNNSDVLARADQGYGGDITISSEVVLLSKDIDLDASSKVKGREGKVTINSPLVDLSGSFVSLPADFIDAGALLPASCERRAERRGSFILEDPEGLPLRPDTLVPGGTGRY